MIMSILISCGTSRKLTKSKKILDNPQKEKIHSEEKMSNPTKILSNKEKIQLYITQYSSIAKDEMRDHRIPASITLAQGILEPGMGYGRLAKEGNNHFGIKCHKEWKGKSIRHDDDEKDECFRSYKNPLKSYRDHSLFLVDGDRYKDLFELKRKDYKGWARGLKAAGYATDPKYAEKLISLIERFNLTRFDE